MVVAGLKEPAVGIGKVHDHLVGQFAGGDEVGLVEGGLVQRKQALDGVRIVLDIAVQAGATVLPGAEDAALRGYQFGEQEVGVAAGDLQVVVALQEAAGVGEGGQHQAVPGGDDLLVAARLGAPVA